jgi:hypothetical protein
MSAGVNADIALGPMKLFGEIAGNSQATARGMGGITYSPAGPIEIAAHVRSFSDRYVNPLATGFGESGGIAHGEQGRYLGIVLKPARGIRLSFFYDEFSDLLSNGFRGSGKELNAKTELSPRALVHVGIQWKEKSKMDDAGIVQTQRTGRVSFSTLACKPLELSQRFEYTVLDRDPGSGKERGFLAYTDAGSSGNTSPFRWRMRLIVFETDSYAARLYEFESDVIGAFSAPPMYGRGMRWYVMCSAEPWRNVSFSTKYSETVKWDSNPAGGAESQVTFQLEVML